MSEANKALMKRFVTEYQTNHDEAVLYELLSADFVDHSAAPGLPAGREGVRVLFEPSTRHSQVSPRRSTTRSPSRTWW